MLDFMYVGDEAMKSEKSVDDPEKMQHDAMDLEQGSAQETTHEKHLMDKNAGGVTEGYVDSLDDTSEEEYSETLSTATLRTHVHVYAFADYYQIAELKQLALYKFKESLTEPSIHLTPDVIEDVYEHTLQDDKLRKATVQQAVKEQHLIILDPEYYGRLRKLPDFFDNFISQISVRLLHLSIPSPRGSYSDSDS
ncbi:MAG: hypothetical protein Q9162_004032 [Coniocarpon cinnabarinum]